MSGFASAAPRPTANGFVRRDVWIAFLSPLVGRVDRSGWDAHYYFVRPDFPDSDEIVSRLRSIPYHWSGTLEPAVNFAAVSHATNQARR